MNAPIDHYRSNLREQLPALRSRWGVVSLEIFGSRARGEARNDSDLDVLVTLEKPIGLFQFVELEAYLTELLGVKVDLVLRSALKPKIGERILAEAVPV
jgi:predicted nucleotidyltransferase